MKVKWYKDGKLTPDENYQEESRLYVVRTWGNTNKFSHDGFNFFIGYIEDDKIFLLEDITNPTNPVVFSNIPEKLKNSHDLTYTDIINLKLDNIWVMNKERTKGWKYSHLKDIFSEEQIDFYK
jgi:hypothetical protein